jgi:glycosyltransferase involved in cell wall biosynthesis
MSQPRRVAWFSPLPPVRSGIASDNAELLARLDGELVIDRFVDDRFVDGAVRRPARGRVFDAHDFVWKHQLDPYDLVTYQLGNASCHDYMWAYLAAYPGLVVLHDPRLHHARARQLLSQRRFDDYRHEFWYDHPGAPADFVEYAVEGLGGSIYYFWPMLRVVMHTARIVAVHNERVAADLRGQFPETPIAAIRLGKAPLATDSAARSRIRSALRLSDASIVFAVFGKLTAEKRIASILRAFSALAAERADAALLLAGDGADYPSLGQELEASGLADRVRVTGYVAEESIGEYLAAADVCLCLRWPTAQETSGSWLQCLAAGRPTVISDLAHLVDVPALDPKTWRPTHPSREPVAVAIDLLEEDRTLRLAMGRLADDERLRADLARAGHAYWSAGHTLDLMVADYRRLIEEAAGRPAPRASDLPAHVTCDYSDLARSIARQLGVQIDIL